MREYYSGFFKGDTQKYADLTIELVKTLSDKELKTSEGQRMAEKKISSFYEEDSQ